MFIKFSFSINFLLVLLILLLLQYLKMTLYVNICKSLWSCVNSGFRREADENCALLSHYAASSGNLLPIFRDNLSVLLSGVGKKQPLLAA